MNRFKNTRNEWESTTVRGEYWNGERKEDDQEEVEGISWRREIRKMICAMTRRCRNWE